MTRDEILNMPAGREMDALIVEKVLQKPPCVQWVIQHVYPLEMQNFGCVHNGHCYPARNPSFYSTEISAAWEVVEKMKDNIFCIYWKDKPNVDGWSIQLSPVDSYSGSEVVYGETFPLAICRAALLAVMETA